MLFFGVVDAFIFMQSQTGRYLGKVGNDIALTRDVAQAIDISLQPTEPKGASVILSLGTKALAYDKKNKRIALKEFENDDKALFFRMVLNARGLYLLQHEDRCVGAKEGAIALTDCTNQSELLELNKSDTIPGLIVKHKLYNPITQEQTELSSSPMTDKPRSEIVNTVVPQPEYVGFGTRMTGIPSHSI